MKRHLRTEVIYTLTALFMMNLLLAGSVEETPRGLLLMIAFVAIDIIIFSILRKNEKEGF